MPCSLRAATSFAICVFAAAPPAFASGFELRETSASAMGTAYAGAAASDGDASLVFFNPAAASGVADYDVSVNATALLLGSHATFSGTTAAGTPTGGPPTANGFIGDALVPAFSVRYRLDDQWSLGLAVTAPWGEVTSYPTNWTGRYYALGTSLTAFNATPVVSYQVTPEITLAAGAQIQYVRSQLTQAIDFGTIGAASRIPGSVPGARDGFADLHGHSWGAGYVVGALWRPMPSLSLGLAYRSEVQQVLKGTEVFQYDGAGIAATINHFTGAFANSTGKTDLPTPATATAGLRWQFAGGWSALAGVEYTNWSSLKQLLIVSFNPANPPSLTVLDWKNTWFGSLGLEYQPDDRWTLRVGTAYDAAAAPPTTLEPRIPDADRYWLSAGVGYRTSDDIDVNFAVSHLFAPHSDIAQSVAMPGNAARGSLTGVSNSDAMLVGLQLVIR